jgi:hypothetical protein
VASSVSQGHDLLFLFFGQMSEGSTSMLSWLFLTRAMGASLKTSSPFLISRVAKSPSPLPGAGLTLKEEPVVFSMMIKLGWMEVCSASLPLGTSSLVEVDAIYGGLLEKAQRTSDYKFLR